MTDDREDLAATAPPDQTPHVHKDWLLAETVEMFNRSGKEVGIGITLYVGGLVVSGTLIGGKEYFEKYGEIWGEMIGGDSKAEIAEFYSKPASLYGPEGEATDDPSFIHLRDARVYSSAGKPIPANTGVLWRAKLFAVDAFSIGNLVIADNE